VVPAAGKKRLFRLHLPKNLLQLKVHKTQLRKAKINIKGTSKN
jgi:hypothetical protein